MSISTLPAIAARILCVIAIVGTSSGALGEVFFTDTFTYADGQLTGHNGGADVSGGLWTTHSPTPAQTPTSNTIQVVGGEAVVKASGAEDVSRSTNTVIPEGGTWYFGAKFKVGTPTSSLTSTPFYFIHLKDEGTFNFRTRVYVTQPNAASSTAYSLGVSAGSLTGGGAMVPWTMGDFQFGDTVTIMGRYTSADGVAETPDEGFGQLWVNPANQGSPSIIDSDPNPSSITDDAMSRLALRQAGAGAGQPDILVDVVSVGNSFADVLAALGSGPSFNPADFDQDGSVDGDDLQTIVNNFGTGTTPAQGDADVNGLVDGADVLFWQREANIPQFAAVPEPASAALLLASLGTLAAFRRRAA